MLKLETALIILLPALTVFVFTMKQPPEEDVVGQLKQLINKQREDFERKFHQQDEQIKELKKQLRNEKEGEYVNSYSLFLYTDSNL